MVFNNFQVRFNNKLIKMAKFKKILRKKSEKELILQFISILRKLTLKKEKLKERFSLVLPGGTSPINLYNSLSKEKINWNIIDIFLSDERFVSENSVNSNFKLIKKLLLSKIIISEKNIFSINTRKKNVNISSHDYEKKIKKYFENKKISFDLVVLGMGFDGHIASIFPGSKNLVSSKIVGSINRKDYKRITLNLKTINNAKNIYLWLNTKNKSNSFKKMKNKSKLPVNKIKKNKLSLFMIS